MRSLRCVLNRAGFTLIEMAIVIIIMGIVISTVMTVMPSLIQSAKIKNAQALLEKADHALQGYSMANHRLPFADSGTDGVEDEGVFAGNLPYLTLGLSSGDDVWSHPIGYAVYGTAAGTRNLTQSFADAAAFCAAIKSASTAGFETFYVHTSTADPCTGATEANAANQAYVLFSSGLKDMDGINGFADECNGMAGVGFNIPGKIQSPTYDDLVRAYSLNELIRNTCSGISSGGSGSSGPEKLICVADPGN